MPLFNRATGTSYLVPVALYRVFHLRPMATITQLAKSASDRSVNELFAYDIRVVNENVATFLGSPNLPQSTLDPVILNNIDASPGPSQAQA